MFSLALNPVVFAAREVGPDMAVGSSALEPWEEVVPPLASSWGFLVWRCACIVAFLSGLSDKPVLLGFPS